MFSSVISTSGLLIGGFVFILGSMTVIWIGTIGQPVVCPGLQTGT